MIKIMYIAGPLFNAHEWGCLEDIAYELEADGYDCFLPDRDQTGNEAWERELDGTEFGSNPFKKQPMYFSVP